MGLLASFYHAHPVLWTIGSVVVGCIVGYHIGKWWMIHLVTIWERRVRMSAGRATNKDVYDEFF